MPAALDDWRAFYEAATTYHALAPWRAMLDSDVFGVKDPATGSIAWVSVLGNAGELLGLIAYRGRRGFDLMRRMHVDPVDAQDEAIYGQDAMALLFGDREELDDVERKRLSALKLAFRGRGDWPSVQSHEPGRLPLSLPVGEVRFFTDVVRQTCVVAQRFERERTCLDPDERGRLLVRTFAGNPNAAWGDEREAEPKPLPLVTPAIDLVRVERLRRSLKLAGAEMQCDVFPVETVIDDGRRPAYAPAMFLLVDGEQGVICRFGLDEPLRRLEFAQREFLAGIEELGFVPTRVFVARAEVERVLAPIAAPLGIELVAVDELPAIECARRHLAGAMHARSHRGRER